MKHVEVVCALIENEEGKIFCCQRGPGRALMGKWEFPGGKIEVNETKEHALIREIKEELSSDIEIIKYLGSSYYEYTHIEPFNDFSITLYGYLCKLIKGNLTLTEHTHAQWVDKECLGEVDFSNADLPFIKML